MDTAVVWLNGRDAAGLVAPYRRHHAVGRCGANRVEVQVADTNVNALERQERTAGLLGGW